MSVKSREEIIEFFTDLLFIARELINNGWFLWSDIFRLALDDTLEMKWHGDIEKLKSNWIPLNFA